MPSEPRSLHPLTLVFSAISVGRGFLLPAIFGGFSAGGGDIGRMFAWGLAFLSVPALLYATAKYATFRYRINDDELILDSGVLSRRRRVIPIARVQNIDTQQSVLQRLTGVAEVRVETAGGDRTEAVLEVLALRDAEALQAELLTRRRVALGNTETAADRLAIEGDETLAHRLAHMRPADLVLAGATANEAGLIAAALAAAIQMLEQLPFRLPEPNFPAIPELTTPMILLAVLGLILFFALLGWLVSIVGAVIGYHDFTLTIADGELRKDYGLLARRHATIPVERVQAMRVEESLLRRPFRLASLKLATAGAAPGERRRTSAQVFLPLARLPQVTPLSAAVFPDFDYAALTFSPVHPRARRRAFIRYSVPVLLAAAALAYFVNTNALWLAALTPAMYGAAHLHYRHLGYALAPGYVIARAGFWNRITWIVPDHKIQTVHLTQTPLQRRHRLTTLVVDTAAGGTFKAAEVVDLGRAEGTSLLAAVAQRAIQARKGR